MVTIAWARRHCVPHRRGRGAPDGDDDTAAEGRPAPRRARSAPVAYGEATVWALAAASCAAMGAYVPLYWDWALECAEDEVFLLRGAQLVLATVEEGAVVIDCLVATDGRNRVPFTLRARWPRRCRAPHRAPAPLRRWAKGGAQVDISLRDRAGTPVARFFGPHAELALELESTSPHVALGGEAR